MPFLSWYPIHSLHRTRDDFHCIYYRRFGVHSVPRLPSCLCGVALEPFYRRIFWRLMASRCCFRFHIDNFRQRNPSTKLLYRYFCGPGTTYFGSIHNNPFQSHRHLPGDYLWSLQEHYGEGSELQGFYAAHAWGRFTDLFEGTVTWQPSVLYVSPFVSTNTRKQFFDYLH